VEKNNKENNYILEIVVNLYFFPFKDCFLFNCKKYDNVVKDLILFLLIYMK